MLASLVLTVSLIDPSATKKKLCIRDYVESSVCDVRGPATAMTYIMPLELGGVDNFDNQVVIPCEKKLWRDAVVKCLYRNMCKGRVTLKEAQRQMREDWYLAGLNCKK